MTSLFLCGPLAQLPLLSLVLGRPVAVSRGSLKAWVLRAGRPGHWPELHADASRQCEGLLLHEPRPEDLSRLDYLAASLGQTRTPLPDGGPEVWQPLAPQLGPDAPEWAGVPGDPDYAVLREALSDLMRGFGTREGALTPVRWQMMLLRAASRLRAADPGPARHRHAARPDDIRYAARTEVYANYFSVEEYDLSHRHFDGSFSDEINRAVFISGDAATVLPYDPVRDRVLLVEQIRMGPLGRGAPNPWMLEAIAGRVDPFETPEDCARREAVEEAGVELQRLIEVSRYYPSPGAKSEFIYSYVAICDLPDDLPRLGGLAEEAEDIRAHLVSFDELQELIRQPEAGNAPLILSAYWLAAHRDRLRGGN